MSATLVLIFLLNGVQVNLPAPALMFGDSAFVPARAVFEKLGWEVKYDGVTGQLTVSRGLQQTYQLSLDQSTLTRAGDSGAPLALPAAPRLVGDFLYVPVRAVSLITGARTTWDAASLTVNLITAPSGSPVAATIGEILAAPPAFAGKLVRLRGEYLGWQADPYGPAVKHGPPVTRSDWVLRDATGALYCTPAADGASGRPWSFSPLTDVGRRLELVGVVALADAGFPYLQLTEVSPLDGTRGIVCYLTTDRASYAPGDKLHLDMQVRNPGAEAVTLRFPTSQQYDFFLVNADEQVVWKWSQDRMFAQAFTSRVLAPGESYTVSADYQLPADLPPGKYQVRGQLNREIGSYPKTLSVVNAN
ncbi:MAG TPA: BsuPI-related putative proteinase inhibitor [Armatimonadota bacterium]|jgi:hypothetical protein